MHTLFVLTAQLAVPLHFHCVYDYIVDNVIINTIVIEQAKYDEDIINLRRSSEAWLYK